jgi:RNA polymerase sigma-70 factor (ECF subfamily)
VTPSAALFVQHRGTLVNYAASLVGSRPLAEDLVQEAWLRFDEAERKQFVREPLNYLYRIVKNLALDRRRRSVREGRIFAEIEVEDAAEISPAGPTTPETEALYRDELRRLAVAIDALPERTRIAFKMHRLGGARLNEIAEFLGISVTRAQVLVNDAAEHCREQLGWSKET